jgi:hypothetical protein
VPPRGSKGKNRSKLTPVHTGIKKSNRSSSKSSKLRHQTRQRRITNEIRHYNRIGDFQSEFSVACWNCRSKLTVSNGKLYEAIEEASSDHIGFLGMVEHRDIFDGEPNGRITSIAAGW